MQYKFIDENKEHLHTLDGKPLIGTSTVLKVLSKPLTYWAAGLAVKVFSGIEDCKVFTKVKNGKATKEEQEALVTASEAWLKEHKNMDVQEHLDLCQAAYTAHATNLKETAEEGTDLHAECEKWVKSVIAGKEIVPHPDILPLVVWARTEGVQFILSEANVYSEKMWTGGQFDVLFKLKNGKLIMGDFKSAKEAYVSYFLQDAGYAIQLAENGAFTKDGKQIAEPMEVDGYAVFPFGGKVFMPVIRYDVKELQEGFKAVLTLHKLINA